MDNNTPAQNAATPDFDFMSLFDDTAPKTTTNPTTPATSPMHTDMPNHATQSPHEEHMLPMTETPHELLDITHEPKSMTTMPEVMHSSLENTPKTEKSATESISVEEITKTLKEMQEKISALLVLLEKNATLSVSRTTELLSQLDAQSEPMGVERVVMGVFNGEHMRGSDGKIYTIPPNYASKSKLVEGDKMKLSIQENGKLLFKQIGPIDRDHIKATLSMDESGQWYALADQKQYKVLNASVSFYKGKAGDTVSVIIPRGISATWAAIDALV